MASKADSSAIQAQGNLPIVGIGASAGGIDALESFLAEVPPDCGMAFVVIQHLDPEHHSFIAEVLQRSTAMPVREASEGTQVAPDCVYVLPPNKYLALLDNSLHLVEPPEPRGFRQPIDFFFRTLAEEKREQAIGVILSGMGADGTLGLRAIKEQAGLCLAQEPATAQFDAMPRSAMDAGVVDVVAPVGELPGKICGYVTHLRLQEDTSALFAEKAIQQGALDKIYALLRSHTGHDFSHYKKSTVARRIERRMTLHQIAQVNDYAAYLGDNPQERGFLFKELLIGVTNFFRDPEAWSQLQEQLLPALLERHPNGKAMRAWVAGCSTGEEAYTLAMAFKEVVERYRPRALYTLQVFATDLDPDAIDRARQGYYPADIAADVSPARLGRFFVDEGNGYRVCKEIREMVVFATQNLIMDPPFSKLDMVTCRNVLIYLDGELQKRLMALFHYALNPHGILFLGNAETIGGCTDLFVPAGGKGRLYWRADVSTAGLEMAFPSRSHPAPAQVLELAKENPAAAANLQSLADNFLVQQFGPAAVLVNGDGDILYINGRTGKYLEPAAGKANWNIYVMAREGLREELPLALPKALRSRERICCRNVRIGSGEDVQVVDLYLQAMEAPLTLNSLVMVVFAEPARVVLEVDDLAAQESLPASSRMAELEKALQQAREENQAIREEMQTSREELRATNEELQSTNEELQSSNEELTTSKEEMQSLNEELQTLNLELQSKVEELSAANNDMKNLLNSTDIATVFLDSALCVRRYTNQATRIFKLIPGDVGRPLSDLVSQLHYPDLQQDALEVLRTLVFSEKQIPSADGRWYIVKIMPYRTLENVIDGVVITFLDISMIKQLEAELGRSGESRPPAGTGQ